MSTTAFGAKLKEQVEERLNFYEKGTAPTKNIVAMQAAMADAGIPSGGEKKKDKKKKKKAEAEEARLHVILLDGFAWTPAARPRRLLPAACGICYVAPALWADRCLTVIVSVDTQEAEPEEGDKKKKKKKKEAEEPAEVRFLFRRSRPV